MLMMKANLKIAFSSPTVSFLALRYLTQSDMGTACLACDKGFYNNIYYLSILNVLRLSNSSDANSEYVEWDFLDRCISQTIYNHHCGTEDSVDLRLWRNALMSILRYVKDPLS